MNLLRSFLMILTVLQAGSLAASGQSYRWIKPLVPVRQGADTLLSPTVRVLAVDALGNTYRFGSVRGDYVMDGVRYPLADVGRRQVLTKYAPDGAVVWHHELALTDSLTFRAATIDEAGNLRAVGILRGRTRFGGQLLATQPNQLRIVVAEWAAAGGLRWVRAGAAADDNNATGARVQEDFTFRFDRAGRVLMGGGYVGRAHIGPVKLPNLLTDTLRGNSNNSFFAVFDSTGTLQWVKALLNTDNAPTGSFTDAKDIGADSAGNVYIIGSGSRMTLDGHPLIPATMPYGTFWAKLSKTGQFLRSRAIRKDDFGYGSLAVDAAGFSYIADAFDNFNGPVDVGGIVYTSASKDNYVLRLDPNGVLQWSRLLHLKHDSFGQVVTYDLALDARGLVYLGGMAIDDTLLLGTLQLPVASSANGFVAALDAVTGQPRWLAPVSGTNDERVELMAVGANGDVAFSGFSTTDSTWFGSQLVYIAPNRNQTKDYVALLSPGVNTIQGSVFVDTNANGLQDGGERGPVFGAVVEVDPGALAFSAAPTGPYAARVGIGTFTTSLPNPPPHYTVQVTGPATATFASYGNVAPGPHFALRPIPNQQDVQVLLTLISPARPGNLLNYQVQYRNTGTVAIPSGRVTLTYDGRLTLQSSTQPTSTTAGQTMTWNYASLQPGETRRLSVVFRLATTAQLGTVLSSTATLEPLAGDLLPADNTSLAERTVTASYDPNDIQVNHVRLNTSQVQNGEWLEYTIRFQNHGTDTAFTVRLVDTLAAALLRLSTVQVLAASHNCNWGLSPQGILYVEYPDIRLPAQITNQVASDGFVRFRVRPATSLVGGDEIPNQARIFFDYNVPLATNTVRTAIDNLAGLDQSGAGAEVSIWPNPATGTLHVRPTDGAAPLTLKLIDPLGRLVLTRAFGPEAGRSAVHLDLTDLPAGYYILRGEGAGTAFRRGIVVR